MNNSCRLKSGMNRRLLALSLGLHKKSGSASFCLWSLIDIPISQVLFCTLYQGSNHQFYPLRFCCVNKCFRIFGPSFTTLCDHTMNYRMRLVYYLERDRSRREEPDIEEDECSSGYFLERSRCSLRSSSSLSLRWWWWWWCRCRWWCAEDFDSEGDRSLEKFKRWFKSRGKAATKLTEFRQQALPVKAPVRDWMPWFLIALS
jgi:hypothetical protein